MKTSDARDMTPSRLVEVHRCFGEAYCLQFRVDGQAKQAADRKQVFFLREFEFIRNNSIKHLYSP
jgi:hypothetical protein